MQNISIHQIFRMIFLKKVSFVFCFIIPQYKILKSFAAVDMSMKLSGLAFAGANNAWSGKQIQSNIDDGILLAEEIPNSDLC
jgi:hypothetical protein